jgi:hypothetical protein
VKKLVELIGFIELIGSLFPTLATSQHYAFRLSCLLASTPPAEHRGLTQKKFASGQADLFGARVKLHLI